MVEGPEKCTDHTEGPQSPQQGQVTLARVVRPVQVLVEVNIQVFERVHHLDVQALDVGLWMTCRRLLPPLLLENHLLTPVHKVSNDSSGLLLVRQHWQCHRRTSGDGSVQRGV